MRDLRQWGGVEAVQDGPAVAPPMHQAGVVEHLHMLGDGLPGESDLVVVAKAVEEFEERLFGVVCGQRIEDRAAGRSRERVVHIRHRSTIGKSSLACKPSLAYRDP